MGVTLYGMQGVGLGSPEPFSAAGFVFIGIFFGLPLVILDIFGKFFGSRKYVLHWSLHAHTTVYRNGKVRFTESNKNVMTVQQICVSM